LRGGGLFWQSLRLRGYFGVILRPFLLSLLCLKVSMHAQWCRALPSGVACGDTNELNQAYPFGHGLQNSACCELFLHQSTSACALLPCFLHRELTPSDGHPVLALSWSPTGDAFLAVLSSAQPRIYDRCGGGVGWGVHGGESFSPIQGVSQSPEAT
jgi:hypothetical protein